MALPLLSCSEFSDERIDTVHIKMLDGNHRITVEEKIFDSDVRIPSHAYHQLLPQGSKITEKGKFSSTSRSTIWYVIGYEC